MKVKKGNAISMHIKEFEQIVKRFQGIVFAVAFGILLNEQESYDLVQNALLKAYMEPSFMNEDFDQKNWLIKVVRNEALNLKKSWWRKIKLLADFSDSNISSLSPDISDFFEHEQSVKRIRKALEMLDADEREIIVLRYYAGYKYERIAEEIGIKIGTVMSRLSRAKARITELMGEEYCEE